MIGQENKAINTDIQSPSDGTNCQPPFINQLRNDQPFSVIPAYYSQLFQGTPFPQASRDNDNVSNIHKPCNLIWLRGARLCQAVCQSRRMEGDAKSVRQQPQRRLFFTSEETQGGDYASAFYSCSTRVTHIQSLV